MFGVPVEARYITIGTTRMYHCEPQIIEYRYSCPIQPLCQSPVRVSSGRNGLDETHKEPVSEKVRCGVGREIHGVVPCAV